MIERLLLLTALAIAGAVAGGWLGTIRKSSLELLVHVGAGALLGITVFDVLPDAMQHLPVWLTALAAGSGFGLLFLAAKWLGPPCPACTIASGDPLSRFANSKAFWPVLAAIGLHCAMDGLVVTGGAAESEMRSLGLFLGVALHKLPEGLALGLLIAGCGAKRSSVIALATLVEAMTLVGGWIGLTMLPRVNPAVLSGIYAIVGGGFLFLAFNSAVEGYRHGVELSKGRSILVEACSFAGTGAFFWVVAHLFAS